MSTGIEVVDVVDRWLQETLSGDATLSAMVGGRITGDEYPAEWANPLVHFDMSSTRDIIGVGYQRVAVHAVYLVKVIGESSSYAPLRPIASRIDTLLQQTQATAAYGSVTCVRESVVRYGEALNGVRYRHLGGMYRIFATT